MYDFKLVEKKARAVWHKHTKELEKTLHDDTKRKLFSFLEGPPTANAPPALHHLEVRTFKDIICKFKYMQGYSVPRKGGWDCHGLPVEVQVEKALGLKDKKDIVRYGVDKFIAKARDSVFSNISEWNKSTEELNYLVDLKHPYVTLDNDYIESVWWSLKELYKKNLLYEGYKVLLFCPRCGTPLSSHEVAQGYKDVKEDSVYIAFKVKGKNEYILAWTTTPWTLPGNVALAVGKDIDYVKVELPDKDKIIVAREKADLVKGGKIVEEMRGKDLEGLSYEPLYAISETQNERSHKVVVADFVTTEDGTGVVHTAVMYGIDDYELGTKKGLPAVHTVGQDGRFLDIVPKFKGKFVKDAEKDILEDLKKRHLLFRVEKFEHSYPFCWRCDSPLLYYGVESWFIDVPKVRKKLVTLNKKIHWVPAHIKDRRFGNWLEGAKEWSLSRFKFWGTPLPIWKCSCGKEKIVGSVAELKKEAVKMPSGKLDLHKPWIDKVKLKCSCGKEMTRVSDVIDCWYDSGSASFAQFHYPFEHKKEFEKRFPYDFIAEAIDQTRGWFYTLHVLATILFEKPAYKNVLCAGHIVDENGEKMSKSKGNIIKPREIIDAAGIDAIRLQFCTSDVGNFKRFSFNLMNESVLPFLNVLYNTNNYFLGLEEKKNVKKIEDTWILSRLYSMINDVSEQLEHFMLDKAFERIAHFVVNDLSRGYIRMTRERDDTKAILKKVLENLCLVLAPFAPHIAEYLYSNFEKHSVHLASWPKVDKKKIDAELEKKMDVVFKIIETGLAQRDRAQLGLKWPLAKATVLGIDDPGKTFVELIASQLNVKDVAFTKGKEFGVELDTVLSPTLEAEGFARQVSRQIQILRKNMGLHKTDAVAATIVVDEELKAMLDSHKIFIQERTNSQKLFIVTTPKERFKNKIDFSIKGKKGEIGVTLL